MRKALVLLLAFTVSICFVSSAYADTLDDVFMKFIYGALGLLCVGFIASVAFIVNKFNTNVLDIFALIKDMQKDVSAIKINCAGNHGKGKSDA